MREQGEAEKKTIGGGRKGAARGRERPLALSPARAHILAARTRVHARRHAASPSARARRSSGVVDVLMERRRGRSVERIFTARQSTRYEKIIASSVSDDREGWRTGVGGERGLAGGGARRQEGRRTTSRVSSGFLAARKKQPKGKAARGPTPCARQRRRDPIKNITHYPLHS